jgi:hypothetical protein
MNAMHLHLILNHAPLFGELFASALLAAAAPARSRTLLRTALVVLVATAAISIPVFFTGRRAADSIGKFQGVSQEAIDPHASSAEAFLAVGELAGLAAGVVLWLGQNKFTQWGVAVVGTLTAAALILALRTAYLGGAIRHDEIRARPRAAGASSDRRP